MVTRWKKKVSLLMALLLFLTAGLTGNVSAAETLSLFTSYTSISVQPGETVTYTVEVINNSNQIQQTDLSVEGLPDNWEWEIAASGWNLQRVAVKPDDSTSVQLQVDVPLEVDKGTYRFQFVASGHSSLPLVLHVSEQGTVKTELTTDQPNMEGHAGSNFNFQTKLRNRTAEQQLYALTAEAPAGWDIQFKVDSKNVTSVQVEANSSKDVYIDITPPPNVKAGSYKFPIKAATSSTSAETELEVVITGSYELELSTPTGLLSTDVTAGGERRLQLLLTNKGTSDLRNIELSADTPVNWEVEFEPKKVDHIAAGQSAEVTATIKADSKAIAGDYLVNMTASTAEATAKGQFRVAVKTSLLWGWLGVLVIAAVVGGVYYLFRKYGRR